MSVLYKHRDLVVVYENATTSDITIRNYRASPFIITFSGETVLTEFDIHRLIELGLRVVRFKMRNLTISKKIMLLSLLNQAVQWCCEKYDVSTWPVALSIDIPNACIKTGFVTERIATSQVYIKEGSMIHLTSDPKFWTKCDDKRIFIDDSYTMPFLVPGTEISIHFGEIEMVCVKQIDNMNVNCKVTKGGTLSDCEFVCLRGVKHVKPALSKRDMEIIEFAKNYQFDIVTINFVRRASCVVNVRKLFVDHKPLLISTICDQEGLDNIDKITQVSDGIILAREFIVHEIPDKYKMVRIQLYANGICKKHGKPLYLSGHILEGTMHSGYLTGYDLNDITNAVLQGSGFVLRTFKDPPKLITAMDILNQICKTVEPLAQNREFWRLIMEYKMPVNAAEAAVMSAVLLAKIVGAMVIIVPTVSGRTVKQIVRMATNAIVVAITASPLVANQLQLFKGVIAIIYDKTALRIWQMDMDARIKFAVAYGIKFDVLQYGSNYVVLRKTYQTSSYCDHISSWKVH